MKIIKNFLTIIFLLVVASSCDPEEIPNEPLSVSIHNVSADTGDQDDELDNRGEE